MLGRLLHTAAFSLSPTSSAKTSGALESATEEAHTRSLLFPDTWQPLAHPLPLQLNSSSPPPVRVGEFDDRGGLELDLGRDFRIIIAQDALGDQDDPCVLLDTQPSTSGQPNSKDGTDESTVTALGHKRGLSGLPSSRSARSPAGYLPNRPASLNNPTATFSQRYRSSTIAGSSSRTDGPIARDADPSDNTKTFLGCMFGTSSSSKGGPGTKMHIISTNPTNNPSSMTRPPERSAIAESRRREPLLRAYSSGAPEGSKASFEASTEADHRTRDTVLITRMFNVHLPETEAFCSPEPTDIGVGSLSAHGDGLQITAPGQEYTPKPKKLREKKTPPYAISILIRLPSRLHPSRPPSRHGKPSVRSPLLGESPSSSLESDLHAHWALLESLPLSLTTSQTSPESIDDRVEAVVQRWEIIMRALSYLEYKTGTVLLHLLKQADAATPIPLSKPPKEKSMQRTNQKIVQLAAGALFQVPDLREASASVITRVYLALRIPRVVTGLGLSAGSPWVDEARFVARLCGGREQNFFLFNLLTAFLGSHTEWLSLLAPDWYKQRYRMQQKTRAEIEPIHSRTVIVSTERCLARRLIFLLASFLPSSLKIDQSTSTGRPATSLSWRQSSPQSPPVGSLSRQESLRRTVNRRARDNRLAAGNIRKQSTASESPQRALLTQNQASSVDGSDNMQEEPLSKTCPITIAAALSLPARDTSTRIASAGTAATVTPGATTPIAHFSSASNQSDSYFPPGVECPTGDTSASANLARYLQQNQHSPGSMTRGSSATSTKWGSLLSGFWSGKQQPLSSVSEVPSASPSAKAENDPELANTTLPKSKSKLEEMANEVGRDSGIAMALSKSARSNVQGDLKSPPKSIASPPTMRVDEAEGVIDVDIDLPGFLSSSLDSGPASPQPRLARPAPSLTSLDGYASMQSSHSFSQPSAPRDTSIQTNVGGYLRRYHQDFALQSVIPYPEMEDEITASMQAEVAQSSYHSARETSSQSSSSKEEWAVVCTTLIADVRTFSIKRLTLKRKVSSPKAASVSDEQPSTQHSADRSPSLFQLRADRTDVPFASTAREKIASENVMELDTTLTDAVERILGHESGQHSRSPSPSGVKTSRSTGSMASVSARPNDSTDGKAAVGPAGSHPSRYESRRTVVSALEDVVKSVNEDLSRDSNGRNIPGDVSPTQAAPRESKQEENALRDGVKRWLLNVESTEVW